MVRRLTILAAMALAAPALIAVAALAEPGTPEGEDARYQFTQVEDGYLRLDGRTGQVSLCNRRTVGWACLTVADDRAALEQEIARLQNENVAMKKLLLARGVPLPEGIRPEPPGAKNGGDALKSPGNTDIDRMLSTVERVWRRLLEMIGSVQKDTMNKT